MSDVAKTNDIKPDPVGVLETGRRVIEIEVEGLVRLRKSLGTPFVEAVTLLLGCRQRVVIAGMGKSGQICRKIAATLSSTGTPSFFVHAAEAAHGDLGMFARGDVCIAISYSGTTQEVVGILPAVKRLGIPLIAITGDPSSALAKAGDVFLDVGVEREACPMNLAPTASTTSTLAMGDALAVAVLEAKGFGAEDFAQLHPGGALGRRLIRVAEVMRSGGEIPLAEPSMSVARTLQLISDSGLGTVGVVDKNSSLVGVITDGDLRRAIVSHGSIDGLEAQDLMSRGPKTVGEDALAAEAMALMEKYSITTLFIVDPASNHPVGIIHLHDLLRAGIA
jgi:arabinose-5-phosphate isomerase